MHEKILHTASGDIHYWTNDFLPDRASLVFLPGLTADHRLFEPQLQAFQSECNLLTWDAPGHGASRPFQLDFSLMDKAVWLHEILEREQFSRPILIGQSMGGYVSQCYMERFPGTVGGFISIDSAPLQRKYLTAAELWLLKHIGPVYRCYPWNQLRKAGSNGCSETEYGRSLMTYFLDSYTKAEYCALAQHGFYILAKAIEANLPYEINCPALLLCGEKDKAGSAKRYNKKWTQIAGIPLVWVKNAGHNSNTDCPEFVNEQIREFINHI